MPRSLNRRLTRLVVTSVTALSVLMMATLVAWGTSPQRERAVAHDPAAPGSPNAIGGVVAGSGPSPSHAAGRPGSTPGRSGAEGGSERDRESPEPLPTASRFEVFGGEDDDDSSTDDPDETPGASAEESEGSSGSVAAAGRRSTPAPSATSAPVPAAPKPVTSAGIGQILISTAELMALPTSGAAWEAMRAEARAFDGVDLSDQDDEGNVQLLAWALVTVRTGGDVGPIHAALAEIPGTEAGGRTLALGRNLAAVVLAADLVGYRDPGFASWLRGVLRANLDGLTLISTHELRPNNWGTHAGASRVAADLYLGDSADLARAAAVFRGYLGERSAYAGFRYGDLDWQADPAKPVGINPAGATRDGRSIDGVLPDDQRRGGGFAWPPPKENYVYEGLQGALLQAELLHRAGYPAYAWGDSALARAYRWLHTQAAYPAGDDDVWQIPLVNARYGTSYPVSLPTRHGKNFGFTDWLYGR